MDASFACALGNADALLQARCNQFKMTDEQLKLARKLLKQGKSIRYVADVFGVHFTTLYRHLRA
jgi:DNA invertase Pin-like site-specific DNA recombinase